MPTVHWQINTFQLYFQYLVVVTAKLLNQYLYCSLVYNQINCENSRPNSDLFNESNFSLSFVVWCCTKLTKTLITCSLIINIKLKTWSTNLWQFFITNNDNFNIYCNFYNFYWFKVRIKYKLFTIFSVKFSLLVEKINHNLDCAPCIKAVTCDTFLSMHKIIFWLIITVVRPK